MNGVNGATAETLFTGGCEMEALIQSRFTYAESSSNGAQTPLGAIETWPQSLKTAIRIILGSRYPMFVWWGHQMINLYNDAYAPILGQRHPSALGQPAFEVWPDIWEVVGPQAEAVLNEGKSFWNKDLLLIMERNGYREEAYFTFSYSPILADDGGPGGVFCTVTEETERVLSDRRLKTLRELGAETVTAKTVEAACESSASVLTHSDHDVPFALFYFFDRERSQAQLVSTTRLVSGTNASPEVIDLISVATSDEWGLAQVIETGESKIVDNLEAKFGRLPGGAWSNAPQQAVVLPLARSGELFGFLIAGVSPLRQFDDDYKGFFDLMTGQVTTAIVNARAYEEEQQRIEALAELDRVKTVFFSNISHEFRTPLTLMLGPTEDALSDPDASLPAPQRERIEAVQRNRQRLLKLVNTLLDFSRIEAGRLQANYEPTDLAAYTAELASVFRSAIERANLRLTVDCPSLPEFIYTDREMWEKIVLNLLSNAFKFTFEGEISVALRWKEEDVEGRLEELEVSPAKVQGFSSEQQATICDPESTSELESSSLQPGALQSSLTASPSLPHASTRSLSHIVLEVRDTGIGIPASELPHIFERFHQVRGAQGRTYEGSGIGLSLVQELVRLHGGTIKASSTVGQGTRFTVSIPAGSAHLPPEQISATRTLNPTVIGATPYVEDVLRWLPEENGQVDGWINGKVDEHPSLQLLHSINLQPISLSPHLPISPSSHSPKILLADDNADMRNYVRRLLVDYGYAVETARDGIAALAAVGQQKPDLVLADVMMPQLDGFGLLQALRADANTREIPMILLSARAGEEAQIAGLATGADNYLTKPFSARELLARVEASLKLARLRHEVNTAIQRSEGRSRLAIQIAQLGTWRYDPDTHCIELDQRMRRIWGEPEDAEILPLSRVMERIYPDDRTRVANAVAAALDPMSSGAYEIDYRIVWDDGTERWVSANGQTTFTGEGELRQAVELLGTALDITDRKQAEQILQKTYEALEQRTIQLEHANRSLQNTLEELQTIEEELRQQNAELATANEVAELERYRYQDLFNFAPDGYVVTDAKGMIQEANQAVAVLLALEPHRLVNTPLAVYLSQSDHRTLRNLLYELSRQPQLQKLQTDEVHLIPSKRNPIPVAITVTAIRNSQMQLMGARWLIQDITSRKQAEAALRESESRFRLMVESARDYAIFTTDLSGYVTGWNSGAGRLLGYQESEIVGQHGRIFFIPEDVERGEHEREMRKALQEGRAENERWHVRNNGSRFWASGLMMPLHDEAGQIRGFLKIMRDMTVQKQAEAEREQFLQREQTARAEAERANRIKDEFLAVLSHELRSPLNPILGWTQLLRTRKFDQEATDRALETIERNAKLQTQLIEDLLDVSRILRGKVTLNPTPVNLAATTQAAIETVRLAAEAKGIGIQTQFTSEVGLVFGDSARLQQIIWNLLSNAIKFTPNGGQVEVRLEHIVSGKVNPPSPHPSLSPSTSNSHEDASQTSHPPLSPPPHLYAQITVTDTGNGINSEFLPHVFDYFRQEDGKTTRKFGGLGLGLAIVRYLTELHGGTVRAESPGEEMGATFTVTLPLLRGRREERESERVTTVPAPNRPLAGLRILAVDDEADMQDLIVTILQRSGAEVEAVTSASEVLVTLDSFKPDVLISDIGMPDVDGYMMMRQIRAMRPEQGGRVSAIALTAYAGEVNQQQALAAGFQKHISKPIEPEVLIQEVLSLVRSRES